MRALTTSFFVLSLLAFLACDQLAAQAVGSAFTYQGELRSSGQPANGAFDFRFQLYPEVEGGTPIGPTVTASGILVSEGLFSALLDFGPGQFAGDAQWLEVAVRPAGGGAFETLSPRTAITAAPYALGAIAALGDSVTGTSIVDRSVQSQDLAFGSVGVAEVDTSQVQARVSGDCAIGQSIRAINADGTVTCGTPTLECSSTFVSQVVGNGQTFDIQIPGCPAGTTITGAGCRTPGFNDADWAINGLALFPPSGTPLAFCSGINKTAGNITVQGTARCCRVAGN